MFKCTVYLYGVIIIKNTLNPTFFTNEPPVRGRVLEKEAEFHSWPTKFPTFYGN